MLLRREKKTDEGKIQLLENEKKNADLHYLSVSIVNIQSISKKS